MSVVTAYPWVAEAFAPVREEQNGSFVSARCPLGPHDHPDLKLRLWVSDGKNPGSLSVRCWAGCPTLEILRAVGKGWKDCFPQGSIPERVHQEIVARYDYRDENGNLLYQTVRLEPGRHGRDKEFRQRRPDPSAPRGWTWTLGDVRRVLYRLPEWLGRMEVYVVGGEKDADSLWSIGLAGTTNVCGEKAEWLPAYTEMLGSRDITVVQDPDDVGRRHADAVCGSVMAAGGAASIRRVVLPGGRDATGFLNTLRRDGVTRTADLKREFLAACHACPRWAAEY